MGQILTFRPQLPADQQAVTLGDATFTLQLTWRDRSAAWYADLWTAAGDAIWLGARVTPGWPLGGGLIAEGAPDGLLLVRGPSDYERADLGGSVQIVFYPTDELPDAAVEDDGIVVAAP
jgi:hypothetical protein